MGMALSLFAVEEARLRNALTPAPAEEPKKRLFGLLPARPQPADTTQIESLLDELFDFDLNKSNLDADDIDKSWDVIRVALEDLHKDGRVPERATQAVLGTQNAEGGPMGGFGWVPAKEVAPISEALDSVSIDDLDKAIENVPDDTYLAGVREENDDYFTGSFENLRKFYRHAASSDKAVMLVIC